MQFLYKLQFEGGVGVGVGWGGGGEARMLIQSSGFFINQTLHFGF